MSPARSSSSTAAPTRLSGETASGSRKPGPLDATPVTRRPEEGPQVKEFLGKAVCRPVRGTGESLAGRRACRHHSQPSVRELTAGGLLRSVVRDERVKDIRVADPGEAALADLRRVRDDHGTPGTLGHEAVDPGLRLVVHRGPHHRVHAVRPMNAMSMEIC